MSSDPQAGSIPGPDRVLHVLQQTLRRPVSLTALQEELGVDDAGRDKLLEVLTALVDSGRVVRTREDSFGVPEKMNLVVGRLSTHPNGYGFVRSDSDPTRGDLFIPGRKVAGALHGDRVVARVEHVRRSGKREGGVIRILERGRQSVVGRFESGPHFAYVVPLNERLVHDITIPAKEVGDARDGQIVHAEITAYPSGTRSPQGKILEVLGDPGDPRIDVDVIIREYGLRHEFPAEVLAEADTAPTEVVEADLAGREDFRELPIVTIDGENAQDFDDAVQVTPLPGGGFRLGVHIADVAAYVAPGSALDLEARERATSTYFPDRVLPMLPEALSTGICSLRPGVDRLVQSVIVDIDRDGRTVNYEFHDGVIRSAARLTYTEVAAVLDGDAEQKERLGEHVESIEAMRDLREILSSYRRKRGSIDFDLPEPEILLNLRGEVEAVGRSERNAAHRIIEEFMIRANEVVASHLTWESIPTLFRVHDGPDRERIEAFREFIAGLGYRLEGGPDPAPGDLARLLGQLEGRPEQRVIAILMLRSMKQARYETENHGHFGLASKRYTHFTSPIRRYPDLVIHRILRADRGNGVGPVYDAAANEGNLDDTARSCSRRERRAEEAERDYIAWKRVKFMADKVGEIYEGYITGVQSFGFFVEAEPFFVEGLVHVSSLEDDYYRFDEAKHALRGEHNARALSLGDRVRVRVARVDVERRRISFGLEEGPLETSADVTRAEVARTESSERGRRPRRGRSRRKDSDSKTAAAVATETSGEGAAAHEDKPAAKPRRRTRRRRKVAPKDAAAPAKAGTEKDPARKRSRGRRGGRRGTAAAKEGEAKTTPSTESVDAGAATPDKDAAPARRARGRRGGRGSSRKAASTGTAREKKTAADRSKKSAKDGGDSGDSKAESGRAASGAQKEKSDRRKDSGRRTESRRGTRKKASATAAASSSRVKKDSSEKSDTGAEGTKKPKVNPYLTEIDL